DLLRAVALNARPLVNDPSPRQPVVPGPAFPIERRPPESDARGGEADEPCEETDERRRPAYRPAVLGDDAQPPCLHAERLPAAHPEAGEEQHDDRRKAQAIPERAGLDGSSRERKEREREHEEQGGEQQ